MEIDNNSIYDSENGAALLEDPSESIWKFDGPQSRKQFFWSQIVGFGIGLPGLLLYWLFGKVMFALIIILVFVSWYLWLVNFAKRAWDLTGSMKVGASIASAVAILAFFGFAQYLYPIAWLVGISIPGQLIIPGKTHID